MVEARWSFFSCTEEELSNFVVLFIFVCTVCVPPLKPTLPYMLIVCVQGLLDDGRRASTIAMGLNKQDKDHLVVRPIR